MVASSLLPELQTALLGLASSRGGPVDKALETRLRRRMYAAVGDAGEPRSATRTLGGVTERGDYRDDEALLAALRLRDTSAFQTTAARYGGQLLGYALRKLPEPDKKENAEEIVGDALLVLWNKAERLEERSDLKALLFKIVRNKLVDYYRKLARTLDSIDDADTGDLADDNSDPLASLLVRERRDAVLAALDDHCNPLEQDVLLMTANGMTDGEIAEELSVSTSAARQHRSRGRKKLRKALGHG